MREYLTLPNGKTAQRVSRKHYLMCEHIRNYVLRTNYETGEDIFMLKLKAAKLFNVSERQVDVAIKKFPSWYYYNGERHKPIEAFIEEDKRRRNGIRIIEKTTYTG